MDYKSLASLDWFSFMWWGFGFINEAEKEDKRNRKSKYRAIIVEDK